MKPNKTVLSILFILSNLLTSCGTDIGAPDYGAREMPKRPAWMSHDEYWQTLKREHWF